MIKKFKLICFHSGLNAFAKIPISLENKIKIMNLFNINRYEKNKIKLSSKKIISSSYDFLDLLKKINGGKLDLFKYFNGKICLEYGPATTLEIAQLLRFFGAKTVICCDIFPFYDNVTSDYICNELKKSFNKKYNKKIKKIDGVYICDYDNFNLKTAEEGIYYIYNKSGSFKFGNNIDFLYSKAVLEHVDNLPNFFDEISNNLKKKGESLNLVDFKSHGIQYMTNYDHLLFSKLTWWFMSSNRNLLNKKLWSDYEGIIKSKNNLILKNIYVHNNEIDENVSASIKLRPELKKFKFSDLKKRGVSFLIKKK